MFSTSQDKNTALGATVGSIGGPVGTALGAGAGALINPTIDVMKRTVNDTKNNGLVNTLLAGGDPISGMGIALGDNITSKLFGVKPIQSFTNKIGLTSDKAKKQQEQAQQLAMMQAISKNAYNSDVKNAADKLAKDTNIMDQTKKYLNNEDLLQGYYDALGKAYNKNQLGYGFSKRDKVYDDYLSGLKNKQQATWQRDFNNMFNGYGTTNDYLDDLWNMNSANDFNTNYLNDYYNDTKSKLDSAKSRGLLNEAGYNSALNTLNQRNSAAGSGVRELTDSVLNNYRDDWTNLASNIQTGIDNYNLGQRNMNLGEQWNNQYNDLYGRQQQGFEGDMYNALSGYTPYDVSDILANARNTQGVINPQATEDSELLSALQEKESKKNKVGLGNQGIF